MRSALLFVGILLVVSVVEAKRSSGVIVSSDEIIFLDKFCYDTSGTGNMTAVFGALTSQGGEIVAYSDSNWRTVLLSKTINCTAKIDMSELSLIDWVLLPNSSLVVLFEPEAQPYYVYIAVANCLRAPLTIQYNMEFTQYQQDWYQQFSFDLQGLEVMYLLFSILYLGLVSLQFWIAYRYWMANCLHVTLKLLVIIELLQVGYLFLGLIHYGSYASNGVGAPGALIVSDLVHALTDILFMLFLIYFGRGWGVIHPSLGEVFPQRWLLLFLPLCFFIVYIILFFCEEFTLNVALNDYIYSSPAGIIYIVARFITCVYFIWGSVQTWRDTKEDDKKRFILIFTAFFSVWFLIVPLAAIISYGYADWYRMKTVVAVTMSVEFVAFIYMALIFWPSRARKVFEITVPYDMLDSGGGYDKL